VEGVSFSTVTGLIGINLEKEGKYRFIVLNQKGEILLEKPLPPGTKISKYGGKIYATSSAEKGEGYELRCYDLKGNILWTRYFSLPPEISGNEEYIAEFLANEAESQPLLVMYDIRGNKLWERDFSTRHWYGHLLYDGRFIVIEYDRKSKNYTLSLFSPEGNNLWQYQMNQDYHFPRITSSKGKYFFVTLDRINRSGRDAPPENQIIAFDVEKGFLWRKGGFFVASEAYMSEDGMYLVGFNHITKEIFSISSDKEIEMFKFNFGRGSVEYVSISPDNEYFLVTHTPELNEPSVIYLLNRNGVAITQFKAEGAYSYYRFLDSEMITSREIRKGQKYRLLRLVTE